MHTHMHTQTNTHMHTHTHVHAHARTHARARTHLLAHQAFAQGSQVGRKGGGAAGEEGGLGGHQLAQWLGAQPVVLQVWCVWCMLYWCMGVWVCGVQVWCVKGGEGGAEGVWLPWECAGVGGMGW